MPTVDDPGVVLEALQVLMSPEGFASTGDATRQQDVLGQKLMRNLGAFDEHLKTNSQLQASFAVPESASGGTDVRWSFVLKILQLLKSYNGVLATALQRYKQDKSAAKGHRAPPMPPDTLSFAQQKLVTMSVQFVVGLGVCPNLHAGVGVPLERRSGYAHLMHTTDGSAEGRPTTEEQEHRLFTCIKGLVECVQQPCLGGIVLPRHLGDILAGLIQMCHTPPSSSPQAQPTSDSVASCKKDPRTSTEEHGSSVAESGPGARSKPFCTVDRVLCADQLHNLVLQAYQPSLVRELIMLQGAVRPPSRPGQQRRPGKAALLTRSPAWLRKACGSLLSQCLMRPDGVQSVLRGILEGLGDAGSEKATGVEDWRKCDASAQIIANCPMQTQSLENYYQQVAPQVVQLLRCRDKMVARQFSRVAVSTVKAMITKHPEPTERYVMQPLMQALRRCSADQDLPMVTTEPKLWVAEVELSECVDDLHRLHCAGADPHEALTRSLQPVIPTLFQLHCFVTEGTSHLRRPVQELLSTFLHRLNHSQTLSCLQFLALGSSDDCSSAIPHFIAMHPCVGFSAGSSGGIVVLVRPDSSEVVDLDSLETKCRCAVTLLQELHSDDVSADFFLVILKSLTEMIVEESDAERLDQCEKTKPSRDGSELLDQECRQTDAANRLQKNFSTLSLLGTMCETLGPACFRSVDHILEFIRITLERGISVLDRTEDPTLGAFESETLTMAMGLLSTLVVVEVDMSAAESHKAAALVPLLQTIANRHPDSGMQEMATGLSIAVATHGKVQTEDFQKGVSGGASRLTESAAKSRVELERRSGRPDGSDGREDSKSLIQEMDRVQKTSCEEISLSTPAVSDNTPYEEKETISMSAPTTDTENNGQGAERSQSSYIQALQLLKDPLIPVKGHGLIVLKRLIERGDREAIENQSELVELFKKNIAHEDTYIYLSAIEGLCALGYRDAREVLPVLVKEYANWDGRAIGERSSEVRMKLGEVVVKVTRSLGDLAPSYRDLLLPAILSGARDADPLVRASSVSGLGELCKLLRFSLGGVLHEVLSCVGGLVKHDAHAEVRQAAALFTVQLLQGLGTDALALLQGAIRDLYRLLRSVEATEKDEMTHMHVQLALEELEQIMHKFLFPTQSLSKKIHVLDAPQQYWK